MRNSLTPARILVVDDYEPFRCFLRATLEARPELRVIGEACDGFEAVHKAVELQPDLILLDVGLPTLNGIEAARQICELFPAAKILFVSQNSNADVVAAALSNGAKGYLLKVDAHRELLLAVESVLRGQRFTSAGITRLRPTAPSD